MTRAVVIGVGNPYRGDDAVGLAVANRLRECVPPGIEVLECEQEPSRLLDAWDGADVAIVVDASASGSTPGTVHRFDADDGGLPARVFRSSTHAFGVGEAVELGRALGRLPRRVIVYGVDGGHFVAGEGLSEAVAGVVDDVVAAVLTDLGER